MPGGVFLLLRVRNKEGAESMTHPAPGVPCKGPTAAHQMAGQRYKKLAIYRRSNLLLILSPARTYNALREPETWPLGSVAPKRKTAVLPEFFYPNFCCKNASVQDVKSSELLLQNRPYLLPLFPAWQCRLFPTWEPLNSRDKIFNAVR